MSDAEQPQAPTHWIMGKSAYIATMVTFGGMTREEAEAEWDATIEEAEDIEP